MVAAAVLVAVLGFIAIQTQSVSAARPGDFTVNGVALKEGDRITAHAAVGDPDIYIVNDSFLGGFKRNFQSPVTCGFYGHFGVGGCFAAGLKQVSASVRDAFATSCYYMNGDPNSDGKVYFMEATSADTGRLHWVNVSQAEASAADPSFFVKVFKINSLELNYYPIGAPYTSMSQVPACITGEVAASTTPMQGNIFASLSVDNPAAGTLVKSSAANDLAHFTFSGSGMVTSLKFKRLGVSADSDLTNVYLYEGARRLTDAATVANGEISFNDTAGLFSVAGSKNIAVKADIGSTTGITIGVQLISFNGNSTSISGNLFTVANGDLATVTLSDNTDPSTNSSLDPADDVIVFRQTITANTRYVWMKAIQLRVVGSVLPGDLQNFRMYLAGTQIGSAVSMPDSNGYIVFDLSSNPVKIETGSRELKVLANVVNGSGRNFKVSFRQAADLQVVDSQYNSGIVVTAATGSFPSESGQQTISAGTLTITKKTDSPAGDIIKGAAGVVVARFEFKANGERMKVENLKLTFTESDGGNVTELRNGAIFADGVQVGSTQDILEDSNGLTYTQYNLGSSLIVTPGVPRIVEIRADIADGDGSDGMDSGETLTAAIYGSSSNDNVQRLTSLDYVDDTTSNKSGNQLTIKTGTFSAAKYSGYANQSVVSPSTNVKVGHFTLTAASAEAINVNTINLDSDAAGTFLASDLTNMYIKVWNDSTTLIYTSPAKATVSATASNSYSVNFTLPVNKTYQVEVYADVAASETSGQSLNLELDAQGINAGSSSTALTGEADGQTITVQTGSLTVNNGSIPAATLAKSADLLPAYSFTVQPAYDDFYLDEVYVDLSSTVASSSGAVARFDLLEGSTLIGSATVNTTTGSASFTGLNRFLPQSGGTKTYTVNVQFANVGVGANDTAGLVKVRLDGYKYRNSAGSPTTVNGLSTSTYTGNNMILHATYPTFTNVALPTTTLTSGTQTLFKTAVTSSNGNVGGRVFVFTSAVTAGPTVTNFKVYEDGSDISSSGTIATASYIYSGGAGGTGTITFTLTGERTISGHTYELRGDVAGSIGSGDSIVTKIANPSSSTSGGTTASAAATAGASIVWSDYSAVGHSTSTTDWMNDYLVKNINISQSLFAGI